MEVLIKKDKLIRFYINVEPNKEYSFDFKVFEVTAWNKKKEPLKENIKLYIKGIIQWYGSACIYFGDDGSINFHGLHSFTEIKQVLDAVLAKAEKEIEYEMPTNKLDKFLILKEIAQMTLAEINTLSDDEMLFLAKWFKKQSDREKKIIEF